MEESIIEVEEIEEAPRSVPKPAMKTAPVRHAKPTQPSKKPRWSRKKQQKKTMREIHQELMVEQLNELNADMNNINSQLKHQQKKVEAEMSCENPQMLELVFGHFLEMVAIHYDDIYGLLIDDLMAEEVQELNEIEK